MRIARIKIRDRAAVYHCISRIVGGQFLLDDLCKEKFRKLMWRQAEFCGIQILTYCVMTNHVHILARVPDEAIISDSNLLQRAQALYGKKGLVVPLLKDSLKQRGTIPDDLRRSLTERMGDISVFMKELKQRFSRWYNQQNGRFGTLWAERFKSLLVEDQPSVLADVAAYIDLNPVRANLVKDPMDYRWSGYGEAMGGNSKARAGLLLFTQRKQWQQATSGYRELLYLKSANPGRSGKHAVKPEEIRKVIEKAGHLTEAQALRVKIRYFTDGIVLGSEAFVNEIFVEFRDRFSQKRKSGARKLRNLPFPNLRTCRSLSVGIHG